MMLLTTRALQNGPAGLTFAFQNPSAVFPGMILFILFGIRYGLSLIPTLNSWHYISYIGTFSGC